MVDVAALAGVSYQTVSRVVNGHPSVAPDTRARVERAIAALGFRPNRTARTLITGEGISLAVVAGNTALFGFASMIEGIERQARSHGLGVMITLLEGFSDTSIERTVTHVLGQPLAGALVLMVDPRASRVCELLQKSTDVVAVGGYDGTGKARVWIDERAGAETATRYLLELGHRTVHHVAIPASSDRKQDRLAGWRAALTAEGRHVPRVEQADWTARSGYEAGLRLGGRSNVTAVLAGNDDLAIGVIRGLAERGRRVPDDVSVIGFDDQPIAEFVRPALTTVRQDFIGIGRQAVTLLLNSQSQAHDPDVQSRVRPAELIIRESAAPPPQRTHRRQTMAAE